jgi:hypothetical protein
MGERMPVPRNALEEQLESITRDFVRQIVGALRNASFADVAHLQVDASRSRGRTTTRGPQAARKATRVSASPKIQEARSAVRQTADRRAELAERVVKALTSAGQSLGVRALSSELGVAPDLLATPLRELRAAGRIAKHGEKRATTYSVA